MNGDVHEIRNACVFARFAKSSIICQKIQRGVEAFGISVKISAPTGLGTTS